MRHEMRKTLRLCDNGRERAGQPRQESRQQRQWKTAKTKTGTS
jgi:hypothetical protein